MLHHAAPALPPSLLFRRRRFLLRGRCHRRLRRRRSPGFPPGANPLLDPGRLAGALAQVIELGPAHVSAALHGYLLDARRVHEEHPFDADALENAPDRESLVDAGSGALDDHALIALRALLAPFLDLDEHLDGVANVHLRQVLLD